MSWIKEVRLENFMSYDYARIPLKKGVNLIVGPNGSGKSSILLAISLAFGQLYTERSKKLSDLIKWGKDAARVSLIIDNSRSGGRRPFAFSNSDVIMVSRYIKNDGSYWYEIDYREASLYEVQNIFKRIGINPSNMLIIMHQNTLERFSALKDPEKLSLLEDAVGLSGYRNRIVDSETKLLSVESEKSSVETDIGNAEETLGYWKTMYEKYTRRKALEEKKRGTGS
jgi:Chromosome segregation ATPases